MKKVHMIVGAAATIVGTLGIPAAAAAAATTSSGPKRTASFRFPGAVVPAATCPIDASHTALSTRGEMLGGIGFAGECVAFQGVTLNHEQTGLTERVRYYTSGRLTRTVRLAGLISGGYTFWGNYPNYTATEVCQALVANGTSTVKYGTVCEYTSI